MGDDGRWDKQAIPEIQKLVSVLETIYQAPDTYVLKT